MIEKDSRGLRAVAALFDHGGFPYWVDSGSLLGLLRDGREIGWDSDIDLGVWAEDVAKVDQLVRRLGREGYAVSSRRYRGFLYGFTVMDKVGQRFRPVHVHVYFSSPGSDDCWSPQTVVYQPYDRHGVEEGFAPWSRARQLLLWLKDGAAHRRESAGLVTKLRRNCICYPLWGAFVLVRNRFDREVWAEVWPFAAMYAMYTWVVPVKYFERLEYMRAEDIELPIPSYAEEYLEKRYGDWRTPVSDWCYWTDDGCIHPLPPERVVPSFAEEQAHQASYGQ